jgi:hypothetical protein
MPAPRALRLAAGSEALAALLLGEATEPVLLPGLVAQWPAVQAALHAPEPAGVLAELRRFDAGATVGAWFAPPEIEGRFGYAPDWQGLNFTREKLPFARLLTLLEEQANASRPPAIYMGSTTLHACVPGFAEANPMPCPALQPHDPLASLWLGNGGCVALHQDLPDNLACVVAGRRRFTLLPPDQLRHLYVGPLEHTLAGQPTSLVDFRAPDLQRFPAYAEAQRHALVAELGPGDALFIPSLWWHGVEALEPVNLLVNQWWRRSPAWMDSPMGALLHALLTVRDLPPAQRAAWRAQFEHYVFEAGDHTAAHIPEAQRDVLAPLDEPRARALRARLLRRLNR